MMLDGQTTPSGWVLDSCHDQLQVGDVFIADYRGAPEQRFEILEDDRTGCLRVRRPDGETSLMRPSTILAVAKRLERLELRAVGWGQGLRGYGHELERWETDGGAAA